MVDIYSLVVQFGQGRYGFFKGPTVLMFLVSGLAMLYFYQKQPQV